MTTETTNEKAKKLAAKFSEPHSHIQILEKKLGRTITLQEYMEIAITAALNEAHHEGYLSAVEIEAEARYHAR